MATNHELALTLLDTGQRVTAFDQYQIDVDMLKPGTSWMFSLWRASPGSRATDWDTLLASVRYGGQVLFTIDGAPQLNGVIEEVRVDVDRGGGARLVLGGRDLSAAALDWPADPRLLLRGMPLDDCLTKLFATVGIAVVPGYDAAAETLVRTRRRPGARSASQSTHPRKKRIDLSHPRPGERVWQVAESIVRKLGYLMWVAPCADGLNQLALVVDVPNYAQQPQFAFLRIEQDGVAAEDSNVLESAYRVNVRGVPTQVYASGRTARGDHTAARHRVPVTNTRLLETPGVAAGLTHPLWLNTPRARDPRTATQEAQRAISEGMRNWRTYTCTVQGHGQLVDGRMTLYAPNTMATVFDQLGSTTIVQELMLIQRVEFTGSRKGGQTTSLTLGAKHNIDLTPDAT